jgi:putative FmdB family regulatory protein
VPIYEYLCVKCGEFEVTQRITDEPLKRCPTCRGKVQKLISASSFQLKGSGWYLTDYARAGNGKSKKGEASESSGASGSESSASSGETKTGKTGSKAAA